MSNTPMTPTPEGKQLAADLANACRHPGAEIFYPSTFDEGQLDYGYIAFARLATEHLALKAQLEEALADLREIDRIAERSHWARPKFDDAGRHTVADIAAKYRVETDPLVDALMSIVPDIDCGAGESPAEAVARQLRAELSKRGYEIGGKS